MSDRDVHALLSPSGAAGWLVCAGKPAMEKGLPDDSNEFSEEGTAAHAVAAWCLTEGKDAAAYKGRRVDVGRHKTVEVTDDMATGVQCYVDAVRAVIERYKLAGATSVELLVEQRVPIGHITGEPGAEGTADVVIIVLWADDTATIHVTDLKFGRGVKVHAEENPQGMLYALGAIEKFSCVTEFDKAVISIHQPRLDEEPSEWELSIAVLRAFADLASICARIALTAYEHADNWLGKEFSYLTAGEHCRKTFCKARATCPKLAAFVEQSVACDFEVITSPNNYNGNDGLLVKSLVPDDPVEVAQKFKAIDIIEDWCKAVRARAEALLFESHNAPEVIAQLGIKLVQGKQGNRAWASADAAEELLRKTFRLPIEKAFDLSLISPTSAEKLAKAGDIKPRQWEKLQPLITRAPGKPSVAPASDKRPPLVLTPVADDFENVEDVSDLA